MQTAVHNFGSDGKTNGKLVATNAGGLADPIGSAARGVKWWAPRLVGRALSAHVSHRVLIALAVLAVFAVLFVGSEVAQRHFLPDISIGTRHFLLTIQAAITTAVASLIVYLMMHSYQKRLATTAERITRLLESYTANHAFAERFDNPNLERCDSVLQRVSPECAKHTQPGQRCWQVVGLRRQNGTSGMPAISIQQCHECEVFRSACPDRLTELGETVNNLMFLLGEEAKQVGAMRAQLIEKEKMVAVGQLAGGIAHEVCNPLSSISSIVQMLRRSGSAKPQTEELELIESHIERISNTVRQLAGLSQPTEQARTAVDVGDLLQQVVRLVEFDRRARHVSIEFQPPKSLPRTFALAGQLEQVFINLALNALDAMPHGGRLRIAARKRRGALVVTVEDTGVGIDPTIGRRIFEPFFTTKDPGLGTGLGLSVSYSIMEEHGGSLDFTSTPGQGTVFTATIPILTKAPEG